MEWPARAFWHLDVNMCMHMPHCIKHRTEHIIHLQPMYV